ncbi:MAG TPA: hypothetical protein VEA60_07575 [Allosphingosinicella sp.]|nr:hypothetical protein [Allosphingosinicella sp.]
MQPRRRQLDPAGPAQSAGLDEGAAEPGGVGERAGEVGVAGDEGVGRPAGGGAVAEDEVERRIARRVGSRPG